MPIIKDDSRWIRQMFLTDHKTYDAFIALRRTSTSNFYKYEDTTLGGHRTMNPPPQSNRYCDPKGKRTFDGGAAAGISYGMGDYYSEAIDDNLRVIAIRCGVEEYTGLATFFSNYYSSDAAQVVKSGQSSSFFYTAGKLAGYAAILPFLPFILVGRLFRSLAGAPSTKFYYLRPTMPVYWNAVQSLVNRLASNMGLAPPQENTELAQPEDDNGVPKRNGAGGIEYKELQFDIPGAQFEQYTRLLPGLWRRRGGIDIYSLSTRAQRLADVWNRHFEELATNPGVVDDESWRNRLSKLTGATHAEMVSVLDGTPLQYALARWYQSPQGANVTPDSSSLPKADEFIHEKGIIDRYGEAMTAETRDGAQFVMFNIAEAGTVSESMSNSSKPTEIGEKFNSISSGARSARVSLSDGVTGFSGLDAIITTAAQTVTGILDGVQMSGLVALAGNALTDIPNVWDSSSASLPSMSYTIPLRSPYGNKISRFQNLLVPLAMLLAMSLPRSTGAQSYGSPFYIEIYDKGHAQSRLALVEALNITRGVGNVGWTQDEEFLGIDVQLQIRDMSSIMHMPLGTSSGTFNPIGPGGLNRAFFGDATAFTDYVSVLSSMGLADQVYRTRQLARNWRRMKLDFDSYFSVSHAASWWAGTLPGRVVSALSNVRGADN